MNRFRILVCGGRHFDDYDLLKSVLENVLKEKMLTPNNVEIVSGNAKGADSLGEKWAKENGTDLKIFPAKWKEYGKKAGPIRNKQMIDYITCFENKMVVAFVSPNSKGTKQTVKLAEKSKIPVIVTEYGKQDENMRDKIKITYSPNDSKLTEEQKAFGNDLADIFTDLLETSGITEEDFVEDKKSWSYLHTEMHQIIVSKKELYWQLGNFDTHENLFELFTTDKNSHKYAKLLNLLGVKFELIGSFNYVSKVGGKRHPAKPPINTYYRYIFDNYCESVEEVRTEAYPYIEGKDGFSKDEKERLFKKYRAVRYYITPMLATTTEQNYTADFMSILDYVAKNDDFPETTFNSYTCFPDVLRDKVKDFDWWAHDIHR